MTFTFCEMSVNITKRNKFSVIFASLFNLLTKNINYKQGHNATNEHTVLPQNSFPTRLLL